MEETKRKILRVLVGNRTCCIATSDGKFLDNAIVAYGSDEFSLFFGSFSDTVKCRNLQCNPYAAVCIQNVQIHGKVRKIPRCAEEHDSFKAKYLEKFPDYGFYFELQNNELYLIKPLVIWYYDSSKGTMHRDVLVFDQEYYNSLAPYQPPRSFAKRETELSGL